MVINKKEKKCNKEKHHHLKGFTVICLIKWVFAIRILSECFYFSQRKICVIFKSFIYPGKSLTEIKISFSRAKARIEAAFVTNTNINEQI